MFEDKRFRRPGVVRVLVSNGTAANGLRADGKYNTQSEELFVFLS